LSAAIGRMEAHFYIALRTGPPYGAGAKSQNSKARFWKEIRNFRSEAVSFLLSR